MVKKLEYMGQEAASLLMRKIDLFLMPLYRQLPFTYYGIFSRPFRQFLDSDIKTTVLDLGCGDGSATKNLQLPKKFEITGVDIFSPYLVIARKSGAYKKLIRADVTKYRPSKKYDIVMALHVLEHLDKSVGEKFLKKIEKFAKKKIIVATPIGTFTQTEYDENPYQLHRSSWTPEEMIVRGYRVSAQGLKFLWGNENIALKYGVVSYLFFLISALLTPVLRLKPNLGTYMICEKKVK